MSLEQQVAALVQASNNLTGAVNGKVNEIDQKVDTSIAKIENQFINIEGMIYKRIRIPWRYPSSGADGSYAHNAVEGTKSAAILLFPNDTGNLTSLKHVSGSVILSRGSTSSGGEVGFGDFVVHRGYGQFTGIMNNSFGSYEPFITNKFMHEGKEWVALILKPKVSGGAPTDGIWFDVRYRFHNPDDGNQMFTLINPVDERLYDDVFNPPAQS
ncbi:hypothetical protein [Vibrio parahaemolyticus]|uniref:hypothetical protein n=1 Tax=Vibrio parahaemolyticus TaxID=670 RepID=UPI00387B985B